MCSRLLTSTAVIALALPSIALAQTAGQTPAAAAPAPALAPDQSSVAAQPGATATPNQVPPTNEVATAPQGTTASDGLQEIVVTAQRVASSVQRTPISIQVYSGAELQARGVTDIASLARTDSSVNINLSTGLPIIAIRGVASQNSTETGDPAVSVATDGIFTNRPYGTFGGLYDVQRVEILRGPQGTLFGRNSTGGTINVITARPTDSNEGRITGEIGNYNLLGADGYANFAVADGLDARASFDVRSRKGFRNNAPANGRGDDEDLKSGRFQIAFKPSEALSGWLLGQYTQQGGQGNVAETVPFDYVNGTGGEPVHEYPDAKSDGKKFPFLAPYIRDLKHWEVRGGLSYTLPDQISINYLGGFDRIRYYRQQAINPYYGGVGNGPVPVPFIYGNHESPDTTNQELRIASDPAGRFTWQLGAYYFHESSSVLATTTFNPNSNIAANGIEFDYPSIKSTSKALYAQGTYAITDQLKLTAGGRYTWDKKSRDGTFYIYSAQTGLPFTITVPQPASTKSDKPTWTLGVDYQATPRNLLYAKVSTGYKVGGFNDALSAYGPETVTSYEIGSKNSFLNNHVQLNLSGFRMDYNDQQVTQFVTGASSSGSETVNAGSSRIWGAEMNLLIQSRGLGHVNLSGNYTHARYRDFLTSAGWDTSINLDLAGNRLPLSPTWSFAAEYEKPIDLAGGAEITPRVNLKYQSRQYFSANNYDDQKQGKYAFLDLGLDFSPASRIWNLQAYVKNVTNKTVLADAEEFYTFNNYSFAYQPPRTFGLRLSVTFK